MEERDFREHFEAYGEIEHLRVIHEKRKNGSQKNFAFVLYKHKDSLQRSIEVSMLHNIKGFEVDCKPTKLREELKQIQLKKQGKNNKSKKKSKRKKKKKKNNKKASESKILEQPVPEVPKNDVRKVLDYNNDPKYKNAFKGEEPNVYPSPQNFRRNQPKFMFRQTEDLLNPSIHITPVDSPSKNQLARVQASKTTMKAGGNGSLLTPGMQGSHNLDSRDLPSNSNLSAELSGYMYNQKPIEQMKPRSAEPKGKDYFHLANISNPSDDANMIQRGKSSERDRSDTIINKQFIHTALKGYGHYRMIPHETYSQVSSNSGNNSNNSNKTLSNKSTPIQLSYNYHNKMSLVGNRSNMYSVNEASEKDNTMVLFDIIEEEREKLDNASTKPQYEVESQPPFTDSGKPKNTGELSFFARASNLPKVSEIYTDINLNSKQSQVHTLGDNYNPKLSGVYTLGRDSKQHKISNLSSGRLSKFGPNAKKGRTKINENFLSYLRSSSSTDCNKLLGFNVSQESKSERNTENILSEK